MLSGPATLRVVLTLVTAALLAALWQVLPPWSGRAPGPGSRQAPGAARSDPVPGPRVAQAPRPPAPPAPPPAPPPAAAAPPERPPDPPRAPPNGPPAAAIDALAETSTGGATSLRAGTPAASDTRPVAVDLLDLNTAGVQELNRLRGGGLIGRSVVRGRPYGAVEDLLTKRVLSRSTYERVRDQVTVR